MFGSSKEKRFWKWFQKNEAMLYSVEENLNENFAQLSRQIKKVDEHLTFLFGPPQEDGRREFIISANGVAASFPAVEALFAEAPDLPRWVWIKFRPRKDYLEHMTLRGRRHEANQITYRMYEDNGRVGLLLFMEGLTEEDRDFYQHIGFLFLDHILGEYDVETRVGFIEFVPATDDRADGASPLDDLPAQFDWYFEQRKKELH